MNKRKRHKWNKNPNTKWGDYDICENCGCTRLKMSMGYEYQRHRENNILTRAPNCIPFGKKESEKLYKIYSKRRGWLTPEPEDDQRCFHHSEKEEDARIVTYGEAINLLYMLNWQIQDDAEMIEIK